MTKLTLVQLNIADTSLTTVYRLHTLCVCVCVCVRVGGCMFVCMCVLYVCVCVL